MSAMGQYMQELQDAAEAAEWHGEVVARKPAPAPTPKPAPAQGETS